MVLFFPLWLARRWETGHCVGCRAREHCYAIQSSARFVKSVRSRLLVVCVVVLEAGLRVVIEDESPWMVAMILSPWLVAAPLR